MTGTRNGEAGETDQRARARSVLGWVVAGLVAVIVATELWTAGPISSGEYQLSLLAGLASDGLTVGLLAVLLVRPIRPRGADLPLTLGALLLSVAVVYRLVVELIHRLADNSQFRSLPQPPFVDPWVVVACIALGTWLLVIGVTRIAAAPSDWWRRSVIAQVAAILLGSLAAVLVVGRAAFSSIESFPDPFGENGTAGFVTALALLGWTALVVATLARPALARVRWLLAGAGALMLAGAGLDAFANLIAGSLGPPRTWFPSLLDWHDAYVYVAGLNGVGRMALFAAFVVLTASPSLSAARTSTGASRLGVGHLG